MVGAGGSHGAQRSLSELDVLQPYPRPVGLTTAVLGGEVGPRRSPLHPVSVLYALDPVGDDGRWWLVGVAEVDLDAIDEGAASELV